MLGNSKKMQSTYAYIWKTIPGGRGGDRFTTHLNSGRSSRCIAILEFDINVVPQKVILCDNEG